MVEEEGEGEGTEEEEEEEEAGEEAGEVAMDAMRGCFCCVACGMSGVGRMRCW